MKILALSLLAIVALLQYRLWISDSGMREVWRLRREVATQQDANAVLKERNRTLAGEVHDLKKGKSAIEERARTDLGMVGSNETFFQIAPSVSARESVSSSTSADADESGGEVTDGADKPMLTSVNPNLLRDSAVGAATNVGGQ
jgi:cell division protein FtsB